MEIMCVFACACVYLFHVSIAVPCTRIVQLRMHNVQSKHVNNSINLLLPPPVCVCVYMSILNCIVEIYLIVNRFRTSNAHYYTRLPLRCGTYTIPVFRSFSIEFFKPFILYHCAWERERDSFFRLARYSDANLKCHLHWFDEYVAFVTAAVQPAHTHNVNIY